MRTSSPFMARPRVSASGASTIMCRWLPWTEKWMRRKPKRAHPPAKARRRARKQRCDRRFQTSDRSLLVMCRAPRRNRRRGRCGTFLRLPFALRPAPRRAPPQLLRGSSCCFGFMEPGYRGGLTSIGCRPNHLDWADTVSSGVWISDGAGSPVRSEEDLKEEVENGKPHFVTKPIGLAKGRRSFPQCRSCQRAKAQDNVAVFEPGLSE